MEDQPVDPGDLTGAAAPVPQGKAARKRHRLPRAQLRQTNQVGAEEDSTPEAEVDEPVVDAVDGPDVVEPEPPVETETTPRRRRFRWRRSAPAAAAEPTAAPEPTDVADDAPVDLPALADDSAATDDSSAPEKVVAEEDSGLLDEPAEPEPEPAEPEPESEPEPVLVPHRTAGRAWKGAAVAAAALFVAAAAFAGATVQPYLADRAAAQTKFEIAERAAAAITTLWTYTPDDMDSLPGRASTFLTGDFAAEYRSYIDAIAESNKQAQVSNNTQVLGVAVESLTPTEASALVYTNSVATSPVTKGIPSLRYLSYRLTMEERDRQWLVTRMTAVTSLDLTPRL